MKDYVEEKVEEKVAEIMDILNIPFTESNKDTPERIAKMLNRELCSSRGNFNIEKLDEKMKVFPNEYQSNEMVIVKDIPFFSECEHHFLPMYGKVTVGYVPSDKIIGLSKIPRVVKYFSKKPQLQERYTIEIGEYLCNLLSPTALFVEVEAEHMCVKMRGVESECATKTYFKRGDEEYYKEFKERVM